MKKLLLLLLLLVLVPTVYSQYAFYGQIIEKNHPAEGKIISAIWTDRTGSEKTSKFSTLTQYEARKAGYPFMYGHYYFNVSAITNTDIVLEIEGVNGGVTFKAVPGNTLISPIVINQRQNVVYNVFYSVKDSITGTQTPSYYLTGQDSGAETGERRSAAGSSETIPGAIVEKKGTDQKGNASVDFPSENSDIETKESETESVVNYDIIETNTAAKINFQSIIDFFKLIAVTIFIIFSLFMLYVIRKLFLKGVIDRIAKITFNPVVAASKKALATKIEKIQKEPKFVSPEDPYKEALNLMVNNWMDCILVLDNQKYAGYIQAKNFLNTGWAEIKVKEFMSKEDYSLLSTANTETAYLTMFNRNVSKVGVVKGDKIIGEVTFLDMQTSYKGLSKFYRPHGESGLLTVRDIMDTNFITIEKNKNIEDARKLLLEKNVSVLVVMDGEKPVGIFSEWDYITGLKRYEKNINMQNVEHIMSSSITSISLELNLFEANEYMIEKSFHEFPVIVNDKVLGIVSRKMIMDEIYNYFNKPKGK